MEVVTDLTPPETVNFSLLYFQEEEPAVYELIVRLLQYILFPFHLGLGIVGNSLVILVMSRKAYHGLVIGFYFKMLAVAELENLLICFLPFWIYALWPEAFLGRDVLIIRTSYYICFVLYNVAIWLLVCIAIERFIAVLFPLRAASLCSIKRARISVAAIYLYHIVYFFPHTLYIEYEKIVYRNEWPANIVEIVNVPLTGVNIPQWGINLYMILGFNVVDRIIPTATIFTMNITICVVVVRQSNRSASMTSQSSSRNKSDKDLTKAMLVVCLAFLILNTPYAIDSLFWDLLRADLSLMYPKLRDLTYCIVLVFCYVNTSINGYVYMATSSMYMNELKMLLKIKRNGK